MPEGHGNSASLLSPRLLIESGDAFRLSKRSSRENRSWESKPERISGLSCLMPNLATEAFLSLLLAYQFRQAAWCDAFAVATCRGGGATEERGCCCRRRTERLPLPG